MKRHVRIPLLHDHHTHPLLYAAFMDGVDLGRFPGDTRADAVARVRARADAGARGWTIGYGWNSARYELAKSDFDGLGPVAVLNVSLHGLIVNEAGLDLFRAASPDIAENLSDQAWVERNLRRVLNALASEGMGAHSLERFFKWLRVEHGVHHAEEMLLVSEDEISLLDAAGVAGRTTIWAAPALYAQLGDAARARVHGVKLFADGALGARTAALEQPYVGGVDRGMLMYTLEELVRELAPHVRAARPIAVHAIGDSAIEQVLSALEDLGPPDGAEVRIEHAQFVSPAAARRARALGVTLSMQPNFSEDSVHYADRLPAGYAHRNNPFRMLIDEVGFVPGRDLVLGSDGMPHGAREALRQSLFPPFALQALSLDEFVAGYCVPPGDAGAIEVVIDEEGRGVECVVRG